MNRTHRNYYRGRNGSTVKTIYEILNSIFTKDIQQATDHLIDDLQEVLDEEDLIKLATDKYMKNSVTEVGDYEHDEEEDYEDMY